MANIIKEMFFQYDEMYYAENNDKVVVKVSAIIGEETNKNFLYDLEEDFYLYFEKGKEFEIKGISEEINEKEKNSYKKFIINNEKEAIKKIKTFISGIKKSDDMGEFKLLRCKTISNSISIAIVEMGERTFRVWFDKDKHGLPRAQRIINHFNMGNYPSPYFGFKRDVIDWVEQEAKLFLLMQ